MSLRTSNRECGRYVQRRQPFVANHIYAEALSPEVYVVYSYGPHFPMYACVDGRWYANSDGYSRTTQKHKGQAWWASRDLPMYVSTRELRDIIEQRVTKQAAEAA